jgi:NaMN:DMB phosphoribosyltransferase
VGLVGTAAAMVLARSLGADMRAAFTGSHPELAGQLVRTVLSRPAGG